MPLNSEYFEKWMQQISSDVRQILKNQKALNGEKEVFGEDEKILDNQDLSRILKVSYRTLDRYRRKGLPFFKRGQKIHYKASDVKEFVFNNCDTWDKKNLEA